MGIGGGVMKLLSVADEVRYRTMTTSELRDSFLLSYLFKAGEICLTYLDLDRTVIGSAVPLDAPLSLPCDDVLRAKHFLERRELGILNIGGPGMVTVDGGRYALGKRDGLYLGRGQTDVCFVSEDSSYPAEFYLLSYPAHAVYPNELIKAADLNRVTVGSMETANLREITKMIYLAGTRSSQLVMGFTQLATGSVWNTMPPHTHMRRSEVYLYFDLATEQRVLHLMGPPDETRHLVVADRQVVISPLWSIHAGVGTASYSFCWGMGGENQVYDDMDAVLVSELR